MVEIEQTKPEISHTTPFPPGGIGSEISIRDLGVERPTEPGTYEGYLPWWCRSPLEEPVQDATRADDRSRPD